jgi:glycosyltransferase involved in cell wall biosynthesis
VTDPLVTIGIPTFNRARLLDRALTAVQLQDYPNLEVIVSDNASPGDETERIVESHRDQIASLCYIKHPTGVAPISNFMHVLVRASGRYFMWLADDDEISENYVSSLVSALEADQDAASAAGNWVLIRSDGSRRPMNSSSFAQRSRTARAIRFIWRSDDAWFYAMHRTHILRQASFHSYWWPNRAVVTNWAYVFLLDVVLRGKLLLSPDPSVLFLNHDYTQKSYPAIRGRVRHKLASVMRRLNVHYLYWGKCARVLTPLAMPVVVVVSGAALVRDGVTSAARIVGRRLQ